MQAVPALPWGAADGGLIKLSSPVTFNDIRNDSALAFIFADGSRGTSRSDENEVEIVVDNDYLLKIESFEGSSSEITVLANPESNLGCIGIYQLQNYSINDAFAYRSLRGDEPSIGGMAVLVGTIDDGSEDGKDCLFTQDGGNTVIGGRLTESGIMLQFSGVLSPETVLQSVVPSDVLRNTCEIVNVAIAKGPVSGAALSILVPAGGGEVDSITLFSGSGVEESEFGDSSPLYLHEV